MFLVEFVSPLPDEHIYQAIVRSPEAAHQLWWNLNKKARVFHTLALCWVDPNKGVAAMANGSAKLESKPPIASWEK